MEKIINNSISFVIAYIFVFAVVQISTILQAFSYDVPVIVYSSYLDFSTLTSAVSDEVWQSADNVINIFGSGIILLTLLFFLSIVLLVRWKSKKIWIQRILFWIIICSFIRFCDSFICGHIFYLWGFNLVTDFIGLTYPSDVMKVIFVIIMFIILGFGMYFLREIIVGIINPCQENLKKQVKTNIINPSIIGSLIILIIFFPITNKAAIVEVTNIVVTPLLIASVFRMGVAKKFSFIDLKLIKNKERKEKINIALLISCVIVPLLLRIVFDKGIKVTPNNYENYILDNLLYFIVIGLGLLLGIYLLIAYYHHHKHQQEEKDEAIQNYKSFEEMKDYNMFDFGKSKNLDKYNKAWSEWDKEK